MDCRYGAYVTDGTTNAKIPKTIEKDALTLEEAAQLIDERAAKGPTKGKKKLAAKKKPAAKKAHAKKATAKRAPVQQATVSKTGRSSCRARVCTDVDSKWDAGSLQK